MIFKVVQNIIVIPMLRHLYKYTRFFYSPYVKVINKCAQGYFANSIGNIQFPCRVQHPVYLTNPKYCTTGKCFTSGPGLRLEAIDLFAKYEYYPEIIIGNNVSINYNVHIGAVNRIEIADDVLIGSNVLITDHAHGDLSMLSTPAVPLCRKLISAGPVIIKRNVWICDNVSILPNVTIGEGSVIACNSVVKSDIPEFSLAAGCPARVVKKYKSRS